MEDRSGQGTRKFHIVLLGPPAVGKLTVGVSLSKLTGFPVFDNSKTIGIALLIYKYDSAEFRGYRDALRMSFYRRAMQSEITGLISTCCLRSARTWGYLRKIETVTRRAMWDTVYVLLTADLSELIRRAESPERKFKNSLSTREQIEEWTETCSGETLTFQRPMVIIDTNNAAAEDIASDLYRTIFGRRQSPPAR